MSGLAPIALFVYARPLHTQQTIAALAANDLARDSELIVYSDAARRPEDESSVRAVRDLLSGVTGFRSVMVYERPHNLGLAGSIVSGVTECMQKNDRAIVVEDDLVTSKYFLKYMNEALDRYALDESVASIHGYMYPVGGALPEAFFLPGADCWGWASWARAWQLFNSDGASLLRELKERQLMRAFELDGAYPYGEMLRRQIAGLNDSWAIRWHASAFVAGMKTLYPGRSLVTNIGNDASGTHRGRTGHWDAVVSDRPISLEGVRPEVDEVVLGALRMFFRGSGGNRAARIARRLFRSFLGTRVGSEEP